MNVKQKRSAVIVVAIILALVLGIFVLMFQGQGRFLADFNPTSSNSGRGVEYEGKWHPFRNDLKTVLVMGLDKYERPEDSWGYLNNQQADFLILLVIDENAGDCNILHLNRDTMTEIPRLGVSGDAVGTFVGQLALAHTYGSGGSDSCLNATKAVSKLLCGVQIDHYITMTMDGVGIITDLVGGVEVTVMDDFSQVDPTLIEGQKVLLKGDQALTYVRTRKDMDDSSNLRRMERQRQFMDALYEKLLDCTENNPDFLVNALLQLSDSVMSDCTPTQLEALSDLMEECALNSITPLKGEAVKGEEFMEFYTDEDSLKQTVVSLFCD